MNDINNLDPNDDGLQSVIGKDRCQDVTEQMRKNLKPIQGTPLRALGFSSKDIKKSYMKEFEI